MKLDRKPTRGSEQWIAWIGVIGGLVSAAVQIFLLVAVGPTVPTLLGLGTAAVLSIFGLWAWHIAQSLPG